MLQRIAILTFLLVPHAAFAHAHLKKSDPKADSVVTKPPQKLVLSFSEPLETAMS
ncbi:copper resistance protein CopC, partial [Acinetobacter baumannii]